MRKIIPYIVVSVLSCVYAQDAELLIVDDFTGGANEELLEADQSENGNELVEADIEGDNAGMQAVPFSEKKMHFGGRVRLGAAAIFESHKFGATGGAGFAFNYFFYKKLAFQTGLDFHTLVLRILEAGSKSKKMYNVNSDQTYGWRLGLEKHSVINYTLSYFGVSLPLALRVGDRFWGEFGFRFDYVAGWTDYEIPPERDKYGLRDPFKPKTTLYPNFVAGGGINMPMGKWNLDLGLQASVGLSDIETDYETTEFPLFSIGASIAFWR